MRYLSDKNKTSAASQTVATGRIAPKICQGQPPTMCSQCSRFYPSRFAFGGVIAECVNTVFCPVEYFRDRLFEPITTDISSNHWKDACLGCRRTRRIVTVVFVSRRSSLTYLLAYLLIYLLTLFTIDLRRRASVARLVWYSYSILSILSRSKDVMKHRSNFIERTKLADNIFPRVSLVPITLDRNGRRRWRSN